MSNNYQIGDIFVFKTEEKNADWLSKCIATLTKSDTCHASMVYSDNSMVESGAAGVQENNFIEEDFDMVYVMRLASNLDAAPLQKAAKHYLDLKTKYDFPALIILAGLLVYRRIKPTPKIMNITEKILLSASLKLDAFIQKNVLKNPERAMVCSHFVYQVFYDCGKDYHIDINLGNIWSDMANSNSIGDVCIADMLNDISMENDFMSVSNGVESESAIEEYDLDELYKELHEELLSFDTSNNIELSNFTMDSYNGVLSSAQKFILKIEELHKYLKTDMPVDAMFITPGDFVYHSTNLVKIDEIHIKRIKK